jgi:hypothetical protein
MLVGACSEGEPVTGTSNGNAAALDASAESADESPASAVAALDALLTTSVDDHRAVAAAATALEQSIEQCPSDPAPVQVAWTVLAEAWDRASILALEPQVDVRLESLVDAWPIDTAKIDAAIAGGPSTDVAYESLGSNARGLGALEYLLFDALPLTAERCAFVGVAARSIVTSMESMAERLNSERAVLTASESSLAEMLAAIADSVYRLCDNELAMPAGLLVSGAPPSPESIHQIGSGRATARLLVRLEAIRRAFDTGIQPIITARFGEPSAQMNEALAETADSLAQLDPDLGTAIVDQPDAIAEAVARCQNARRTIPTNVAATLGVTLVVPVGDGD